MQQLHGPKYERVVVTWAGPCSNMTLGMVGVTGLTQTIGSWMQSSDLMITALT